MNAPTSSEENPENETWKITLANGRRVLEEARRRLEESRREIAALRTLLSEANRQEIAALRTLLSETQGLFEELQQLVAELDQTFGGDQ